MILVFTGNGKGKTTAALGAAIRSAGRDKKTAIVFFDKGGAHYGEQKILDRLKKWIDVFRFGAVRFNPKAMRFRFENLPEDIQEAKKAHKKLLQLLKKNYFLIIGDEVLSSLHLKLLNEKEVREIVAAVPSGTHLILTGRHCPKWLEAKADLITEARMVKHYFQAGQNAIEGIEF